MFIIKIQIMDKIQQVIARQISALAIIGIFTWTLLYIRHGEYLCSNRLIRMMAFFNVITLQQCLYNGKSVVTMVILLQLICTSFTNSMMKGLLIVWIAVFDPVLMPLYLLHSQIINRKGPFNYIGVLRLWAQIVGLLTLCLVSAYYLNYQMYFAHQFSKNSGVTWILYSHLFQRYLALFEIMLFIIPFICIFPLTFLNCSDTIKLTIQFYICLFVMPNTSLIHLWTLFALQSRIYTNIIDLLTKQRQIVWNTLTIMAALISICSYSFYERIIYLWTHTHLVSVGYSFIQLLLFWGVHAVYLAEALIIMDQTAKKPKKNVITIIKEYLKKKIKQL